MVIDAMHQDGPTKSKDHVVVNRIGHHQHEARWSIR